MSEIFYHVTEAKNVKSILKDGLKCDNDGYIYLLTELDIQETIYGIWVFLPDIISTEQIGIKKYSLFQIYSEGITSEIEDDNVGELVSEFQKRINQKIIHTDYIKLLEERKVNVDELRKYKFCVLKRTSLPEYHNKDIRKLWKSGKLPLPFNKKMEKEMNDFYKQFDKPKKQGKDISN